jgi:hypothetical protein
LSEFCIGDRLVFKKKKVGHFMSSLSSIKHGREWDFQFIEKSPSYGSLSGSDDGWVGEKYSARDADSGFLDSELEKLNKETRKTEMAFFKTTGIDEDHADSITSEVLKCSVATLTEAPCNMVASTPFRERDLLSGGGESSEDVMHFYNLRLSKSDEEKIQGFIEDLSVKNYAQLLRSYTEINQRGEELKSVHPMRFIGHILSDSRSFEHLKMLKCTFLKYNKFISGFHQRMQEAAEKESLFLYAPGFAKHVNIECAVVIQAIKSKKYKDLIEKSLKL